MKFIEARFSTSNIGGASAQVCVDVRGNDGCTRGVGAGALNLRQPPIATIPKRDQFNIALTLPQPNVSVTANQAKEALHQIVQAIRASGGDAPSAAGGPENVPMELMALVVGLLTAKSLANTAQLKAEALRIRTNGMENLRLEQNKRLCDQIDKSIEDQNKARKSGVWSVVTDWVVSAAELASGVVKFVVGDMAGSAADMLAGLSGACKSLIETVGLALDAKTAEEWQHAADIAGKVQLFFEVTGMTVDLVSVGRGVMAAKAVASSTEAALKDGLGQALQTAIQNNSRDVIKLADEIAVRVAGNVTEEIVNRLAMPLCEKILTEQFGKVAAQSILKNGAEDITKAIQAAITKGVRDAVEKVAEEAVKKGGTISVEDLSKKVASEIRNEMCLTVLKATYASVGNITKSTANVVSRGSNEIFQGVLTKERAQIQKDIQTLMAASNYAQFLFDEFDKVREQTKKDIEKLMSDAGRSIKFASDAQKTNGAVLSHIAANLI